MRFELKHSQMKMFTNALCCTKNILRKLCHYLHSNEMSNEIIETRRFNSIFTCVNCKTCSVKWIQLNGIEYKVYTMIVVELGKDLPRFSLILEIFLNVKEECNYNVLHLDYHHKNRNIEFYSAFCITQ